MPAKLNTALNALTVSNKTTQEDIEAVIEKVIADNNPDIEFAWAKKTDSEDDDFTIVEAGIPHEADSEQGIDEYDGKGSITGKIILTNSKSATGDDDDKELVYEISIEIPALKKSADAITAVAAAVIDNDKAKKFAESNDEETVYNAILDAANAAVENDPYVVSFKTVDNKEAFTFKPVKWNEAGEISYTLEVKEDGTAGTTEGKVVDDASNALVQAAVTLAADPTLQTLTEAKAAVEKALTDAEETAWSGITGTTTETAALNTVKTTLQGYVSSPAITVNVTKVSFTAATVKAGGELKCTWSLSKEGETSTEPVELTITTEMIPQTKEQAKDAAKEAGEKITVTKADFADDAAVTAKQKEIMDAVKDALAAKFTVEVKTALAITTEPAVDTVGKASITFSVKEGAEDSSPVEVTCEYTLPALEEESGD